MLISFLEILDQWKKNEQNQLEKQKYYPAFLFDCWTSSLQNGNCCGASVVSCAAATSDAFGHINETTAKITINISHRIHIIVIVDYSIHNFADTVGKNTSI